MDMLGMYPGKGYPPDRVVVDVRNTSEDRKRLQVAAVRQRTALEAAKEKVAKMRAHVNALYATPAMNDPEVQAMAKRDIPALDTRIRAMETDLGLKMRSIERADMILAQMSEDEKLKQRQREDIGTAAAMGRALTDAGYRAEDIPLVIQRLKEGATIPRPVKRKGGRPKKHQESRREQEAQETPPPGQLS